MYREMKTGKIFPANALMQVGFPMPIEMGEYHAYNTRLTLVED
jgi:alpha-galactosidase